MSQHTIARSFAPKQSSYYLVGCPGLLRFARNCPQIYNPGVFNDAPFVTSEPIFDQFVPPKMGFFSHLLPGAKKRMEADRLSAQQNFDAALARHRKLLIDRAAAVAVFEATQQEECDHVNATNNAIANMLDGFTQGNHDSVVTFYKLLIDQSLKDDCDAISADDGFSEQSKQIVVDLELPPIDVIPEQTGFKFIKSANRIDPINRAPTKRKAAYANLICQIALKCIDIVFRGAGCREFLECLTLNGMLSSVDPATGQEMRICLLSIRITPDTFAKLNLAQVDPEACLRSLKASVSQAPAELAPVKPIVELDMVDPRFIDTRDVLSTLDTRQNLMDLSPNEFEGLITNLFERMGLDTRQTRASRDGGVDCVAFDSRPIFGGKVVIQAKRYKGTVGVSAVRDLFGTVQNEGASKGILVTTSHYGKASFEFANGKPLELLDGGKLLYLLAEHAGIEAKIIMPRGWTDPSPDGE